MILSKSPLTIRQLKTSRCSISVMMSTLSWLQMGKLIYIQCMCFQLMDMMTSMETELLMLELQYLLMMQLQRHMLMLHCSMSTSVHYLVLRIILPRKVLQLSYLLRLAEHLVQLYLNKPAPNYIQVTCLMTS